MGLVVAIKNSAEGLAAVHMSLFEPKWCLKDLNSYQILYMALFLKN